MVYFVKISDGNMIQKRNCGTLTVLFVKFPYEAYLSLCMHIIGIQNFSTPAGVHPELQTCSDFSFPSGLCHWFLHSVLLLLHSTIGKNLTVRSRGRGGQSFEPPFQSNTLIIAYLNLYEQSLHTEVGLHKLLYHLKFVVKHRDPTCPRDCKSLT
jgi:hypothetical protein